MIPETRYAYSGDVAIAYQVVGEGERDFVLVPNWINQVEHLWNEPSVARWLRRLGGFGRLILFDRRGTGLSERVVPSLALEDQMEDVRAVMDAAGSGRATIVTLTEGSLMSLLFAATQPERVEAIVLCSPIAAYQRNEDVTWTFSSAERDAWFDQLESAWGTGRMMLYLAPSLADDERFVRWFAQLERLTGTPASFRRLRRSDSVDIRPVLGSITVPTLVAQRNGPGTQIDPRHGRFLAERIPCARLIEMPGDDSLPMAGDAEAFMDEIEEFLTGSRPEREPDRILATVLFTDIVDSTRLAAELGDRRWRDLLSAHHDVVAREIGRYRGRLVKNTGDGVLATFDGPARAIRSAEAIRSAVRELGVEVRAGLHTGECEVIGEDVGGIAVHIGARVGAAAGPGEVLVSGTVRDLVVGSGLEFGDRGSRELKGVPGEWRLYAVAG
ncbi:MAG: adenylate/guanylate cyclase domain-containing protein [Solirubrobacteraceae bacterium]